MSDYLNKYVDDEFNVECGEYPDTEKAEASCKSFTSFLVGYDVGHYDFEDESNGDY